MFPMTIVKRSGRAPSVSGGKDYHLVLISNTDNKAILIQRWGKARQWGNGWKLETYASLTNALEVYEKKRRQKFEGEYTESIVDRRVTTRNIVELRKELGPQYMAAIGKKIGFLIPDLDVSNIKDGEIDTEWVEQPDGTVRKKERERKLVDLPPPPEDDSDKQNPMWGTWG